MAPVGKRGKNNHLLENQLKERRMRLSNTVLDSFFADGASALTSPEMPDIPIVPDQRFTFALNYSLGATKFKTAALISAVTASMSHNATAVGEFRAAKEALSKYINILPEHEGLGYLGRAISHLETCVLHAYVTMGHIQTLQSAFCGSKIFTNSDRSEYDRLKDINNRIKHFDEDVQKAVSSSNPTPPSAIWLSNDSIICSRAQMTYAELAGILKDHTEYTNFMASKFFESPSHFPEIISSK
jgi:hypothetical protein